MNNPNLSNHDVLRAAVESSPCGLIVADHDGRILLVNRRIEQLFGFDRDDLVGKPVETLVPDRLRASHRRDRADFTTHPTERFMGAGRHLSARRRDGTDVRVEIGLAPIAFGGSLFVLASVIDITERERAEQERAKLERELHQAHKMEAIGTLAGGVAHDFNNMLAMIVAYAEHLDRQVASAEGKADVAGILGVAERGRQLVQTILTFSRSGTGAPGPMALGQAIAEAGHLLRATLPPQIEIELDLDPRTPIVTADPTSVLQILMNLAVNARDAMTEGRLRVALRPFQVGGDGGDLPRGLRAGPHAVLELSDTGEGMSDQTRLRAFEPFFTTKPVGKGTGLGLSLVHGIMTQLGGAVELESTLGRGTTVRCYFPAAANVERDAGGPLAAEAETDATGRGEAILLVDDEPVLVALLARGLRALGYRVAVASSGSEALDLFRLDPSAYDAVVTDYSMPDMNGLELAEQLARARTDLPVLLITGLADRLCDTPLVRQILHKPLAIRSLARAIRSELMKTE